MACASNGIYVYRDGIRALLAMIENSNGCANQQIFNIGNPDETVSIRKLAELLVEYIQVILLYAEAAKKTKLIEVDAEQYYGAGYQDVSLRVPSIKRAHEKLGWSPTVTLTDGLRRTLAYYLA